MLRRGSSGRSTKWGCVPVRQGIGIGVHLYLVAEEWREHLFFERVPYGDEVGEFLTATRIIELVGASVKRPLSAKKVAFAMNRLGFEQRRTKYSRGWNVIILTGNDIKEEQRLNAHRSTAEI